MLKLKLADYSSNTLSVYLVDGQYIRDNIYIDFTEGGNSLRYDFIPEGEIWLGGIHIIECKFVLIHELSEIRYALENSLDLRNDAEYTEAHDYANSQEKAARTNPDSVDATLIDLLSDLTEIITLPMEEKTLWTT